MQTGSVVSALPPQQNDGAPSAAGLVIGSPSPSAASLTQIQPVGNSSLFSTSFTNFIDGLTKSVTGAITTTGNRLGYEKAKVLGTVQKTYYQTISSAYGAVGDSAKVAQDVTKTVRNVATIGAGAIGLYLLIPVALVWFASRKK